MSTSSCTACWSSRAPSSSSTGSTSCSSSRSCWSRRCCCAGATASTAPDRVAPAPMADTKAEPRGIAWAGAVNLVGGGIGSVVGLLLAAIVGHHLGHGRGRHLLPGGRGLHDRVEHRRARCRHRSRAVRVGGARAWSRGRRAAPGEDRAGAGPRLGCRWSSSSPPGQSGRTRTCSTRCPGALSSWPLRPRSCRRCWQWSSRSSRGLGGVLAYPAAAEHRAALSCASSAWAWRSWPAGESSGSSAPGWHPSPSCWRPRSPWPYASRCAMPAAWSPRRRAMPIAAGCRRSSGPSARPEVWRPLSRSCWSGWTSCSSAHSPRRSRPASTQS